MAVVKLDITVSEEDVLGGTLEVVKAIRPEWDHSALKHMVFQEGITNKLVGYYQPSDVGKKNLIVVRVYGEKTDLIIDRNAEKINMQILHSAGCAAQLYATFNNGISYGFIPGTCLDEKMVREPHIGRLIAQEMVRLHAVDPTKVSVLVNNGNVDTTPMLFPKLRRYLEIGPDSFEDPKRQERFLKEIKRKPELAVEIDMLEKELTALNSPVVFSHNDILLKNVVYNKEEERAYFIDYEYCAYNYEAFDIGNHFCEFAGMDVVDYTLYPDKTLQLRWLRDYLESKFELEGKKASDVTDRDMELLYVQANKFALAANFFWGLWALIQAKHSTIDFDYLDYAVLRLGEYFNRRDEFLALQLPQ